MILQKEVHRKDQGVETERVGTEKEEEQEKRGTGMGIERVRTGNAWEQRSSRDADRVGTVPTWSDVSIPAGGRGTVLWS